jgi:hypothetical protein
MNNPPFSICAAVGPSDIIFNFSSIKHLISYILAMTSNQTYGSHYGRSRSSQKQAIGKTTLEFLVRNDTGNYLHTQ